MTSRHEIWLTEDTGRRLKLLDGILGLTATRTTNRIGGFALSLPVTFDTSLIDVDRMIQVWRAPPGKNLKLWRAYFIRQWRFETMADSRHAFIIGGPDVLDLMRRRIVASYAGSAQASKLDFADDMMKEVVSESIVDGTNPAPAAGTRVWTNLSVQADAGAGPLIGKAFAWGQLLRLDGSGVLPGLARVAKIAGQEIFFDIVPNAVDGDSITFEFQTYADQPGRDMTSLGVVFDEEYGNLKEPFLEFDYTEEENYIYAGGQGVGYARNVQQISDSARYLASIWNRCEAFADARNQTSDTGVTTTGRNLLQDGQPKIRFGGLPVATARTRFGIDWDFGYKVTARYAGYEQAIIIRSVTIILDDQGRETINARFDDEV